MTVVYLALAACRECVSPLRADEITWTEQSYADFNDGSFSASRQNLFVSRNGAIRTIHRWDFNSDGYLDLVFASSHDFITAPRPTCYELPPGRSTGQLLELPVYGTRAAAVADLNQDGLEDLVLSPNHDWVSGRRYLYVLWGGPGGWSARRMTNLLTIDPRAVQIADLNRDGWPEIIVLNGTRWSPADGPEGVLRIYWGSPESFSQERFTDEVLENARDLKARDLDGDQRPELIVLRTAPAAVLVYWNDGFAQGDKLPKPSRVELSGANSSSLAVADFNGDGRPDLITCGGVKKVTGRDPTTGQETYQHSGISFLPSGKKPRTWEKLHTLQTLPLSAFTTADLDKDGRLDLVTLRGGSKENGGVRILWGDAAGKFKTRPPVTLAVPYASAAAVADLDGDGNPDLVVGRGRGNETYDAGSRIYYGNGKRGFTEAGFVIPTAAVTDVCIAKAGDHQGHRLVFCNRISGRVNEDVPVRVYWGGKDGFSRRRLSRFHIRSGYDAVGADLNDDGHADLVLSSIVHNVAKPHPEIGFNILWGGEDGLRDDRRTVVREYAMHGMRVADLDRDGYLDLIGVCNLPSPDGDPQRVVIWHGGPDGFQPKRRVVLPCAKPHGNCFVADFNRDGYLDLAVSQMEAGCVTIFWGSKDGFDRARRNSTCGVTGANDLNAADLDGDGWLELIVTSYGIPGTLHFDYGTFVFWGSARGFSLTRAQRLPGFCGVGTNVADYDADGHLDLFVPHYHNGNTRESIASFLFWGGADGLAERRRTDLMADSAHAALSADFDGDGRIDIAVSCHSRNGNHLTNSLVYYNDGRRFDNPRLTRLPTVGPHYMTRADMGNIYDRSYRETYVSSVFSWDRRRTAGRMTCKADTPGKSRLELSIRAAVSKEELDKQEWGEVDCTKGGRFSLPSAARHLQYRAVFVSGNGDRYPVLDQVKIVLSARED